MTICEVRQPTSHNTVESWQRREPALPAAAVLGIGPAATALAEAARALVADGAALRLVADPEYLVVLGEEAELPWVDGARYLGWDGSALTLTTHQVLPAPDLWREAALAAGTADAGSLVIVLPDQVLIAAAEHDAGMPAPAPVARPA
ncbi:hypothetical protein ABH926_006661 [Catenulispora sp. GP43]|uniref:bpX5 domain-containing protein n=1 Tax=Catenulispora sp. GP43 TaxID=3156263 RepID=UPI0035133714